jgi:non-ribosomal peptide synthetase-like protein
MILRGEHRVEFLREEILPDILRHTADLFPEKTAFSAGLRHVNYAELWQSATAVGGALSALGAGPGATVGLLLPRGADLLIAQAGIAVSGAAWLPFDAEVPIERAAVCLEAAKSCGVVTVRAWRQKFASLPVPVWCVEDLLEVDAARKVPERATPEHIAYVIYTSGSTGTPKGISISQRNICHFLRSENAVLNIQHTDVVYQGFSVAFDMSFEEIWISYLVGASLWIAPAETVTDPDAICQALESQNITVLHAVPTLVALLERLPAHLRLLNIGGEACPDALAQKLAGKGRRAFNTYGPTETTVTASVAELFPGEAVTIGKPLPNYGMLVLDAQHQPLLPGETGEIGVFGPGVSPGYQQLPELTAARFIANPVARDATEARLYLTGDLGYIDAHGQMHCLGRVDHQVKIRGFRIELDEVAAALARQPGIGTAAAVVRELYGADEIVAFAVSDASGEAVHAEGLRLALADFLPQYMLPAHIEFLEEMPRLISGKIDLHALRSRPLNVTQAPESESPYQPQTQAAKALWDVLATLFPARSPRPEQDFFDDLGGHSLLAARLVSLLRKKQGFSGVGVQHIYQNRTLGKIAEVLGALETGGAPLVEPHEPPPLVRRFLCGTAQLACLPFLILLQLLQWLAPFLTYHSLTGSGSDSIPWAIAVSVAVFLLTLLLSFPLSVGMRALLVGRLKPGSYPLWGVTYFRWWLGTQLINVCPIHLISGTPWKVLHLKMLGARVSRDAMLNSITIAVPELVEIGPDVCIGTFVNLENARVEAGRLILGHVRIGAGATLDSYSVLENDTEIGARARLCGQSTLAQGRKVPAGETWAGAPARAVPTSEADRAAHWGKAPSAGTLNHVGRMVFYALGGALVAVLFFIPTFPAFVLLDWIDVRTLDLFETSLSWWQVFPFFFVLAMPASIVLVVLTALLAGGLRRCFPDLKPGRFPLHGSVYRHKWLLSTVLDTSLQVLHGLYASLYAPSWLRLLGAKIGKDAEISTAEGVIPNLLQLGEGSFIADGALLGDEEQRDGWIQFQGTVIGNRSFVGNSAYVPDGAIFPDDMLLGVQSCAPPNTTMKPGQTWMGSPAMLLPAREAIATPDATLTFHPPLWRKLVRGVIEAVRIVLPMAFIIASGYVIVFKVMEYLEEGEWSNALLTAAGCGLAYCLGSFLLVWALKWLLIGRYAPRKAPMWTLFVWLSEAVTVAYESLAVPTLLDQLRGTPFLPWALRLMGVKIGRGVWLNTTDITEFDCVEIGDFAELNAFSGPQTHLFEDRVMRVGKVQIGKGATLGPRSIVLYDATVGDHCRLGPLTLVAKGETLPNQTRWEGCPAQHHRL